MTARYLDVLRSIDFSYKDAYNLTKSDIKIIASRYNFGTEITDLNYLEEYSYGNAVFDKKDETGEVLGE